MSIKRFREFMESLREAKADDLTPAPSTPEPKSLEPKAAGEKKFKKLHKIRVVPHPIAPESTHTGKINK